MGSKEDGTSGGQSQNGEMCVGLCLLTIGGRLLLDLQTCDFTLGIVHGHW